MNDKVDQMNDEINGIKVKLNNKIEKLEKKIRKYDGNVIRRIVECWGKDENDDEKINVFGYF